MVPGLTPPDRPARWLNEPGANVHRSRVWTATAVSIGGMTLQAPIMAAELVSGVPTSLFTIQAILWLAYGVGLALTHRGYTKPAGMVLGISIWAGVTLTLLIGGTAWIHIFPTYVLVVVIAAMLCGTRAALVAATASLVAITATGGSALAGWLPEGPELPASVTWGLILAQVFGLSTLLYVASLGYEAYIEALHRKREEVRTAEDQFRLLTENIREALWIADLPDGRFSYVSPSVRSLIGVSAEDLGSLADLTRYLPGDDADTPRPDWANLPSAGGTWELDVPTSSGPRRIQLRAVPVRSRDGDSQRAVGIIEDVTELRTAERIIRAQERDLLRAQKAEALGRLAAGIAHDFNNLLTVIQLNARLALESLPPDAPARADLEELLDAGRRAARLTDGLLAYSRNKVRTVREIDVAREIRRLVELLRPLLGPEVRVTVDIPAALPAVEADGGQFEQVLTNLLVNARDAVGTGGNIEVSARTHRRDGAGFVRVTVRDDGVGMEEAVRARIFEPFFTTKPHGTGLGLPTVQGIVEQSRGFIEVHSTPGAGTRVDVDLPASEFAAAEEFDGDPVTEPSGLGGQVLVVDDEPAVRQAVTRVLEAGGYDVVAASGAREGLALLRDAPGVRLVLTDVRMPGESGFDLMRRVRAERPELPIILMSGYAEDLSDGAEGTAFLQKPLDVDALLREVGRHLLG
jgi:two-component system cell cycle sensor histidine kinase/response regulator CckA